jgi:hypothetical protein
MILFASERMKHTRLSSQVGNSYLRITSGVPVIRPQSLDRATVSLQSRRNNAYSFLVEANRASNFLRL